MGSHADGVYAFGPYRLDAGRRTLTRQDRPVALAPKTFDLLLLMVQRPAHAFSKQELMAALWPDTFVEEANLSFQVSTLRKTLGDGNARWIETVPRHGYRFAADVSVLTPAGTAPGPAGPPDGPAPRAGSTRTISRWRLAGPAGAALLLPLALWGVRTLLGRGGQASKGPIVEGDDP